MASMGSVVLSCAQHAQHAHTVCRPGPLRTLLPSPCRPLAPRSTPNPPPAHHDDDGGRAQAADLGLERVKVHEHRVAHLLRHQAQQERSARSMRHAPPRPSTSPPQPPASKAWRLRSTQVLCRRHGCVGRVARTFLGSMGTEEPPGMMASRLSHPPRTPPVQHERPAGAGHAAMLQALPRTPLPACPSAPGPGIRRCPCVLCSAHPAPATRRSPACRSTTPPPFACAPTPPTRPPKQQQHNSPACRSMSSLSGMLISSSTVTGRLTCPLMANSLVPCATRVTTHAAVCRRHEDAPPLERRRAPQCTHGPLAPVLPLWPSPSYAASRICRTTNACAAGPSSVRTSSNTRRATHAPSCSCGRTRQTTAARAGGWWGSRPPSPRWSPWWGTRRGPRRRGRAA